MSAEKGVSWPTHWHMNFKNFPLSTDNISNFLQSTDISPRFWTELPQPNSTQPKVGLALFSYDKPNHNHNHKPQTEPSVTFSQLLDNQTRPNSVCNLISTQLEDSCQKKLGHPNPFPPKNSNKKLFTHKKKLFSSTKFSLQLYRNLN